VRVAASGVVNMSAYALRHPFRPGVIKDVSADGLYIISPFRFAVGDVLDVELMCEGQTYPFRVSVRHVNVDDVSARTTFGAGTQLIRSPQSAAVLAVIMEYVKRRTKSGA
jgi:hypothetical protein